MKQKLRRWLTGIGIFAATAYIIALIVDLFAPDLRIFGIGIVKLALFIFCVIAFVNACFMLGDARKMVRQKQRKLREARQNASSGGHRS